MSALRQRVIERLYGDGVAALIASAVADRAITELRASIRKEPELIDVSRLEPGETYHLVARPAPGRRQRAREAELDAVEKKLAAAERPSRARRRAERRLARVDRRLANPGSGRRTSRAAARRPALAAEVERRSTPDARTTRLRERRDHLAAEVARGREAAMARARARVRPPRRTVFR